MRGWPRRILAVLIGFAELWPLNIVVGEPGTLAFLVMTSVACTAGLGLLIWIPFCWVLGEATLWLLGLATGLAGVGPSGLAKAGGGPASGRPGSSQRADMARYIARMREAGVPDEHLRERLRRAGWDEGTVASLLQGED